MLKSLDGGSKGAMEGVAERKKMPEPVQRREVREMAGGIKPLDVAAGNGKTGESGGISGQKARGGKRREFKFPEQVRPGDVLSSLGLDDTEECRVRLANLLKNDLLPSREALSIRVHEIKGRLGPLRLFPYFFPEIDAIASQKFGLTEAERKAEEAVKEAAFGRLAFLARLDASKVREIIADLEKSSICSETVGKFKESPHWARLEGMLAAAEAGTSDEARRALARVRADAKEGFMRERGLVVSGETLALGLNEIREAELLLNSMGLAKAYMNALDPRREDPGKKLREDAFEKLSHAAMLNPERMRLLMRKMVARDYGGHVVEYFLESKEGQEIARRVGYGGA
ncbi:MAG: hypothetical protein PHF51_01580 [Candidatus ainarchaeum sp.]|nr:hypothetical protein [Candidatus ainarchaeum sp.]